MEKMNKSPNLFKFYKQEENQFTNGLISVLSLSKFEDKTFVSDFFNNLLSIKIPEGNLNFKVLEGIKGTTDAEISNDETYLLIETKIRSGTLRKEQIEKHKKTIASQGQKIKRLILLTPDDSESEYVKRFIEEDPRIIIHLGWKKVYNYLDKYILEHPHSLFTEIISQYLSNIHDRIFEQDIVAVIVKIKFGDESGVYSNSYLDEMKRGEWDNWRTPRKYKNLDGKGRKLILYDRERKSLTMEVEIEKVEETKEEIDYPWSNKFVHDSIKIYKKPISVEEIRKIKGFEKFGKDRAPFRNVTYDQYKQLIKYSN